MPSSLHATPGSGVPVVNIEAKFASPSRLGEKPLFALSIAKLGHSSATFELVASSQETKRMQVTITVVWMENWKAHPWPAEMRKAMMHFMEPLS